MAAAVAPTADQTSELLQSLSLDSQTKALEIPEPTKKVSVDSTHAANGQIQPADRSFSPLIPDFMDPTLCYLPNGYPYYYGGYDGTGNEWEGYPRYVNAEGVEMPGVYGDNSSLVYQHGYGYTPYGPYSPATSPVPTVGHDGQLYGAQHYQYPTPYFQPLTSGPYPTPAAPAKGEIPISAAAADQATLTVDSANANSNGNAIGGGIKGNIGSAPLRPAYQNSSFNMNGSYGRGTMPGGVASGYQDPRFAFDGLQSPLPWQDATYSDGHSRPVNSNSFTPSNRSGIPSSRNQNSRQMGLQHTRPLTGTNTNYTTNGYMNRMYPNNYYGQYGNTYGSGLVYGSSGYNSRTNNRGWLAADNKFKPRGRGGGYYGFDNENLDGLNELNRGPRAKGTKNQKGFAPVTLAVKGQQIPLTATNDNEKENSSLVPDREQYNRPDFPETYSDAKFFVIKSYSEDDVHKSVKYNVWSSTPNGNKKLDETYKEAQQKSSGCPVFLFFSVNTSGQFVGVAEMVGPVDFNKKVEYWQQDKWIGCFPVKWHIVKDVPNSLLKHITLENNENKPVTNSRDTQEVKLEQGLQMIKIFKDHTSKQCILDDFEFYEDRQKRIQDKKAKQQLFLKQVSDIKATEEKKKEATNGELKSQIPAEVACEAIKKATPIAQSNGDIKPSENGSVANSGDLPSTAKVTPSESKSIANGVVNGS
ncbi:PREDICTED: uncharacterized protein LOC109152390 [Ipomoea nil]|uniref:uncharacterized protein LOC109152390 n=1 Tax=Ipomoea nil TaxID=35883 RepID=UPI000901BA23|nr:PREDICTED: uncharacterized protein LOC109152390 [Ipomoea nil]